LAASLKVDTQPWMMAAVPSSLHEDLPHLGSAGLGDAGLLLALPAQVLTGDQVDKGGRLPREAKAGPDTPLGPPGKWTNCTGVEDPRGRYRGTARPIGWADSEQAPEWSGPVRVLCP